MTTTAAPALTVTAREFAWEQKYRPDNLTEIILPRDVKQKLQKYVELNNLPSLLFYSPQPGTGKTTAALALAKEIGCIKPLFINASLDNSIDVVREKVISYATSASVFKTRKIVILDEVERLSPAAQESLKGVMEKVSKVCSFILTTNAKARVNEPLKSRCREIDFIWADTEVKEVKLNFLKRCVQILDNEGISYDKKVLFAIVEKHFPDNRKVLGILQDNAVNHGTVDERALAQIRSGDIPVLIDFMKAKKFGEMKQWMTDNQSYITEDFYSTMFRVCVPDKADQPRLVKGSSIPDLVVICGEAQQHHRQVGDLWLHGLHFCTNIMMMVEWE